VESESNLNKNKKENYIFLPNQNGTEA